MGGLSRMGKLEGRSSPLERLPSTSARGGEDASPERSDDGRAAAIPGAVPERGHTTGPKAADWIPPTADRAPTPTSTY